MLFKWVLNLEVNKNMKGQEFFSVGERSGVVSLDDYI